jgi:hypothetical protein
MVFVEMDSTKVRLSENCYNAREIGIVRKQKWLARKVKIDSLKIRNSKSYFFLISS